MGRRARIPSQKALRAQAMAAQSQGIQKKQIGTPRKVNTGTPLSNQVSSGSERPTLNPSDGKDDGHMADEVERSAEKEKKRSVWDNFDIRKISNVGFKLDYMTPDKCGEGSIC
ncbi:hypothetical protein HAX54_013073 [Datura stramonium]|uniref:Uncharacterized protein n=1 Tax=Datura stramonium TaxID=4076 RepID=A0ABS8RXY0_DATST|nr:hypothetical protein [Datura stramonium]